MREFLCESALTEKRGGPISACSDGLAGLLGCLSGWFRDFSSALLPAERRGRSIFGRLCRAEARPRHGIEAQLELCWRIASKSKCALGSKGDRLRPVFFDPLLFDNCIGRKRDVGGGVLAGLWRLGLVFGVSLGARFCAGVRERQLTVTFQGFIAPLRGLRWNAVRRAGAGLSLRRMCLELVKDRTGPRGSVEVTSREQDLIQLESLILAQNERWRQA